MSLRDLLQSRGVRMRGKMIHCPSPSHPDRNPSCVVRDRTLYCHGCGLSWDAIDYLRRAEGMSFADAKAEAERWRLCDSGPKLSRAQPPATADVATVEGDEDDVPPPERAWKDVHGIRRIIQAWLYRLLQAAPDTEASNEWCAKRGIRPATARDAGVRDLWPVRADIKSTLNRFSTHDLEIAGLISRKGRKRTVWSTFKKVLDGELVGFYVPVFDGRDHKRPVAFRLRLAEPLKLGRGGALKALSQPASQPPVPMWPLGLQAMSEPPDVAIIVEGEPDWLSLLDIRSELPQLRIQALASCSISCGWSEDWCQPLETADRVIVAVDRGKKPVKPGGLHIGEMFSTSVAEQLVATVGQERASEVYVEHLLPDDDDVNDWHRRGELLPLIRRLVEGAS